MLGLFDTRVDVYRIDQTPNSLAEVADTPVLVFENIRCTIQMSQHNSRDEGTGSRPGGFATLLIDKKPEIQDQDIIKVVNGPNLGTFWILNGQWTPSNSRWHTEFKIMPYIGNKPT